MDNSAVGKVSSDKMFPSTKTKRREFQFDLEIPTGETVSVFLHTGNQFIVPSDQVQFVLSDKHVMDQHKLLHDDITRITTYRKKTVSSKELTVGFTCVVFHVDQFWRAVVKSCPRVDMIRCFLIDHGLTVLVHTKNVFHLEKPWAYFEGRVLTCQLEGLSAFASSFHLLHILKNQIDWKGELSLNVSKGGVIPTVVVHNSTYPGETLNQIILNYLYLAYDPRRLLQLHQRWPNTTITANYGNGQVDVQLDTPLLHHVQENLRVRSEPPSRVDLLRMNVVYLGIFVNPAEFYERCTFSTFSEDDDDDNREEADHNLIVTFIDTGVQKWIPRDYPLNLLEILPEYPAITRIPPLAARVQFNNLESIPREFLSDSISHRSPFILEQVERRREKGEIPLVDFFEPLPGCLLNLNQKFLEKLNPETPSGHGYSYRHFSSLHNWSMPLIGNNWGKGSMRVFDLVKGSKIYGVVTVIDSPGYFYIRPLQVRPLPRLEKGIPVLELKCGCVGDGEFFRVKQEDSAENEEEDGNVRCRLLDSTLPPNIPHMSDEMRNVTVPVYFVDKGTFGDLSPLHLHKLGQESAVVPPQVVLAQLAVSENGKLTQVAWKNFVKEAVGKTLHMEIEKVTHEEVDGYLILSVSILSTVPEIQIPPIPESEQREEEW